MAITQNRWQAGIFDALCQQKGRVGGRLVEEAAGKAKRLEGGPHLGFEIADEFIGPFRILALGLEANAAGEIAFKGAGVEMVMGGGDRAGTGHG